MVRSRVRKPLAERKMREAVLALARRLAGGGGREPGLPEQVCGMLLALFECEAVEIWPCRGTGSSASVLAAAPPLDGEGGALVLPDAQAVLRGRLAPSWRSLVVLPLGGTQEGVLVLAGPEKSWFRPREIPCLLDMAGILGVALSIHQRREAHGERVKELTCLYGLSKLAQQSDLQLGDLLQGISELVPPAWQHPEAAHCRITFDGAVFESAGFQASSLQQGVDLLVSGTRRGRIDVFYQEDARSVDRERPFLPEERNLIEGLAREVALVIERRQLEKDRENLWEQIRHMDRLATLGQLAASVAHELNEPLCGILGLAQLAVKDRGLSQQAKDDLQKIVASSLHARDVVKGLLGFSRAGKARRVPVSLNRVIEDSLGLFSARCARAKVAVHLELDPRLPGVEADPSQIHQVLVNLVVNAIQAMPEGGRLTLRTACQGPGIRLSVEDSGIGMDDETRRQIFIPFFTTKEAGHGTGLGLGIVQSIVADLGGTLAVESRPGEGSRFTIDLAAGPGGAAT